MFKKALRRNIPWLTLIMVTFTLTMGMLLSLSCYVFYIDVFKAQSSDKDLNAEGYVILNKKVSILGMIGGGQAAFSSDEIEELESQPFISEVAPFEAAKFRIKAYAPLHEDRSFYTDLFLESVPSKFLDVGDGFTWEKGQAQLPIIIPRTYLNLYNFGFAPSQGLPQINETTARTLTVKMEMTGPGGEHTFWAKIHDFTDRVNSILVPEEFISWANKNIAKVEDGEPSRVILKSGNTSDHRLESYINAHGYSTNQEMLGASKAASAIKAVIGIEFAQGVLIFLLSLFLILLSTLLLVEKNKSIIYKLSLQGFSFSSITQFYTKYFATCVVIALLFTYLCIGIVDQLYIKYLADYGFPVTHSWLQILAGGLVLAGLSALLAYLVIRSRVKQII